MRAIVFGATGYVGHTLVTHLHAQGDEVHAHMRPNSARAQQCVRAWQAQGITVVSSAFAVASLAEVLGRSAPDAIYIVHGTTRHQAQAEGLGGDIYAQIDYGLTQAIVDAVQLSGSLARIVYLSALGADPQARSAYLRARGRAEQAVQHSANEWMIARPAIITGGRVESRFGERLGAVVGDALLHGLAVFGAKQLQATYASTTALTLAAALRRLAVAPNPRCVVSGAALREPSVGRP